MVAGIDTDEHTLAERPGEDVPIFCFGRSAGGDQTETSLLPHHGMVPGQSRSAAVPNRVATRIAHVRHNDAIETQSAGYQGGCHCRTARLVGQPGLEDLLIGRLNETRQ